MSDANGHARPIGGKSEEVYESILTSNFYCLSNHLAISLFVGAIEIVLKVIAQRPRPPP